jgi:hypothetical protein
MFLQNVPTSPHGVTIQKTNTGILNAMRTSNLILCSQCKKVTSFIFQSLIISTMNIKTSYYKKLPLHLQSLTFKIV